MAVSVAALAAVGLGGCAGVPVGVSVASFYVDAVLYLRTEKTSTDHLLSLAADRDCAMMNLLREGAVCRDAPPTPLLAELMREVQTVPPGQPADARIQVADASAGTLSDAVAAPGPVPLPAVKPTATPPDTLEQQSALPVPPPLPERRGITAASAPADDKRFLVVVGSFIRREQAEVQRDRLLQSRFHPVEARIVQAAVRGRTFHRVVLQPAAKAEALKQVAVARAAGLKGIWLLPWSGGGDSDLAVAALPEEHPGRM
ncbi:hypothetical protein DEW08_03345 [Azospirillum thermophilum]|uniref:SPOR domain-containing protein n=1 Tax=Azospirillum thermophilum TaxID=2202148 RepID=A0A2S2CLN6_9PROT|nr:hypothetical protein DEW08_03345 [Azospirillum thermophilum]